MQLCCWSIGFAALLAASLSAPLFDDSTPLAELFCSDGKGPLLEGDNAVFPCVSSCPQGFNCEHPAGNDSIGICCPDLELLYDLYGASGEEPFLSAFTDSISNWAANTTPGPAEVVVPLNATLEVSSHYTTEAPSPTATATLFSVIQTFGAPASKAESTTVSQYASASTSSVNTLTPDILPEKNTTSFEAASPTFSYTGPVASVRTTAPSVSSTGFTTTKTAFSKEYEESEENTTTPQSTSTQFLPTLISTKSHSSSPPVLIIPNIPSRKDAEDLKPHSDRVYLHFVSSEIRRTAAETPKLFKNKEKNEQKFPSGFTCNRVPFAVQCPINSTYQFVIRWFSKGSECHAYPVAFCQGERVRYDKTARTKAECTRFCIQGIGLDDLIALANSDITPNETPKGPVPPTPIVDGNVENSGELEEVFPPGFVPEIDDVDNETRVILQSDLKGPLVVGPPDAGTDEESKILSSQDGIDVLEAASQKDLGLTSESLLSPVKTVSESHVKIASLELEKSKSSFGHKLPSPQVVVRACFRFQPYRSMCANSGMPSQYTIRWFVRAGTCWSYPFGYCHGESVMEHQAISSKAECEQHCLGTTKDNLSRLL